MAAALRTLALAVAFTGGIVCGGWLRPGGTASMAAGAAAAGLLAAAALVHRRHGDPGAGDLLPPVRPAVAALVLTGLACAGLGSIGVRLAALENSHLARAAGDRVLLAGRLAGDPRPFRQRSPQAQKPSGARTQSSSFLLSVRSVGQFAAAAGRPDKRTRVKEKAAVTVYGKLPAAALGDWVEVEAKIRKLRADDTYDRSLRIKSVAVKATASSSDFRVLARAQNPALAAANFFRLRIAEAAEDAVGNRRAALLLGLVMGDQRHIPQQVTEDFRAAGLSHLTAVSGQNVAMVLGPLVLLMGALRLRRRTQVFAGLGVLVMFALVTRWEPSVLRAVLMASAALSAWLFGRRSDAIHILTLAFVVLLAIDPLLLWSIGFQLSFAATAGILLVAPALAERLTAPLGDRAALSRRLVQVCAIGIAAQAAVLPLIGWHFGRVSLVALPANLAALALVAPATVLGFSGGLVGLFSSAAAQPLMALAGYLVLLLEKVAGLFGGSAYAELAGRKWDAPEILAAYLVAATAALCLSRRRLSQARWPALLAVLVLLVPALAPLAGWAKPTGMRLTFFDVGQGDAALVESPEGSRVLIDAGPDPYYLGARLKKHGVSRIDLVIASHAHADHIEGLGRVLKKLEVRTAIDPGVDTPVLFRALAEQKVAARRLEAAGEHDRFVIGDLDVQLLGPSLGQRAAALKSQSEQGAGAEGPEINDASVVARVSYHGECALFTGDVEEAGQQALLDKHRDALQCAVLKAPHHGSAKLLYDFVRAVDPEWVAISVGENDYGHPASSALATFDRAGARVVRTDRLGEIVLNVDSERRVTLITR